MSKLKVYLAKHGIKQKEVVEGVRVLGGDKALSESKLSQHNNGLNLGEDTVGLILDYLGSRGLVPSRKTVF